MALPWFRFYAEFEDDPKIRMMSDIDQLRLVYLFCERCQEQQFTDKQRAYKWQIPLEELAQTKAVFMENAIIDENWDLINWNKRQFLSDSSTDRTRRYRERKRTSQKRHGDGHVTEGVTIDDVQEEKQKQNRGEQNRYRAEAEVAQALLVSRRSNGKEPVPLSSLLKIASPRSSSTPLPRTKAEMLAGGYVFINSAACKSCGEGIEWWDSPKGSHLPINPASGVVHLETCIGASTLRKAN